MEEHFIQNTLDNLQDIKEALDKGEFINLSISEKAAWLDLVGLCSQIVDAFTAS